MLRFLAFSLLLLAGATGSEVKVTIDGTGAPDTGDEGATVSNGSHSEPGGSTKDAITPAAEIEAAVAASQRVTAGLSDLMAQGLLEDVLDAGVPLGHANRIVETALAIRRLRTEMEALRRTVRASLARGGNFLSPQPEKPRHGENPAPTSDENDPAGVSIHDDDNDTGDVVVNRSHWRRSGAAHIRTSSLAAVGMSARGLPQSTGGLSAQLAHLESVDLRTTLPFLDANPLAIGYLGDVLTNADYFALGVRAYRAGTWPLAIHMMKQSLRTLARDQARCAADRDAHERIRGEAGGGDGEGLYDDAVSARNHMAREPYNYIQFALYQLGHVRAAARAGRQYLRLDPGNTVMLGNVDYYERESLEDGSEEGGEMNPAFDDDDDVLAVLRGTEPQRYGKGSGGASGGSGYDDLYDRYADTSLGAEMCMAQVRELTVALEEGLGPAESKGDGDGAVVKPAVRQVDRRYNLSYEDFVNEYASKGEPVIIGDGVSLMVPEPWTLDFISDTCGHVVMTARQYSPTALSWGRLVDGKTMTIAEFIAEYRANVTRMEKAEAEGTYPPFGEIPLNDLGDPLLYLFDLPLPEICPEIMANYSVPRYFAGDLLQRIPRNVTVPYRDSWPSLFVGYKHSRSALHVDSFGSHFWMALFKGSKDWRFFDPAEKKFLYEDRANQVFAIDAFNITDAHPLAARATVRECTLRAGEILFVPAGSPHQVRNPEGSIGVSMNYVDATNLAMAREVTGVSGRAGFGGQQTLSEQFGNLGKFNKKMSKTQRDLPWKQFKTWPREDDIDEYTWSPPEHTLRKY